MRFWTNVREWWVCVTTHPREIAGAHDDCWSWCPTCGRTRIF